MAIFNGDKSHHATPHDPKARSVIGSIALGGKPEAVVADGAALPGCANFPVVSEAASVLL